VVSRIPGPRALSDLVGDGSNLGERILVYINERNVIYSYGFDEWCDVLREGCEQGLDEFQHDYTV
jgi:hypothetical protein